MKKIVGNGVEEGVLEGSKGDLLLGNVCWVSGEYGRRKVVFGVCEYESGQAVGAELLAENGCVEVKGLLCVEDGGLE